MLSTTHLQQRMRHHFGSASLLTSRSVNHGIASALESIASDKRCYSNILRYLRSGTVDFTDGTVCEAVHVGDSCDIASIVSGAQCGGFPPQEESSNIAPIATE